jgi:hypothetical protein
MANLQLFENERLKETIRELSASLKTAEQKVQSLLFQQSRIHETANLTPTELGRQLEELHTEIQAKEGKILGLKELVFKVLIEKVGRLDDEEEMEYYLREIDQRQESQQL